MTPLQKKQKELRELVWANIENGLFRPKDEEDYNKEMTKLKKEIHILTR